MIISISAAQRDQRTSESTVTGKKWFFTRFGQVVSFNRFDVEANSRQRSMTVVEQTSASDAAKEKSEIFCISDNMGLPKYENLTEYGDTYNLPSYTEAQQKKREDEAAGAATQP